jgi:hypothetical protein
MPDVFFSYSNRDQRDVEAIARALVEQGITVYLDRWYLQPGQPWPRLLEQALSESRSVAVFVGREGLGAWQQREVALALDIQTRDASRLVIPVLLPRAEPPLGFLSLNTWIDLRHGTKDARAVARMVAAIRHMPAYPVDDDERSALDRKAVSPYRGLRQFREEDAPLFFGRDVFVRTLADAVERQSVVAVVGQSGSGKSSVVMAGLVPLLRADEEHVWEISVFVPGQRPFRSAASALLRAADPNLSVVDSVLETEKLADLLEGGELRLRDLVDRVLDGQRGTDRLLIVVDQWEELYTLVSVEHLTSDFVDGVLDASQHPNVRIVLTMRGDFYGRALGHRALTDQLQTGTVNISMMTPGELREAITGPAGVVGVEFEPGLVERILDDVGDEPGNLPLLEFVLDELWKARV